MSFTVSFHAVCFDGLKASGAHVNLQLFPTLSYILDQENRFFCPSGNENKVVEEETGC